MLEGDENGRSPLLDVFLIDLVEDKVMSFLNLEDMKALSEASKEVLHLVRSSEGFMRRATLDISKHGILGASSLVLPFQWRHLSIDFSKRVLFEDDEIKGILRSAESLHGYLTDDDPKGEEQETKECKLISDYWGNILKKMKNLTTLKIDEKVIYSIEQDLWDDLEFRGILGQLNSLHVVPHSYAWHWFLSCVNKRSDIPPKNFGKFCSIASQLKRLSFQCRSFGDQSWFDWIPDTEAVKCLEHLDLQIHIRWEDLTKPYQLLLECPSLKSFKLSIDEHDNCRRTRMEEILTSFFSRQPRMPLEELDIWITESEISNHIKLIPLLTATLPDDMASKIKKLHLSNEGLATLRQPMEWGFLEKMTQLRDISIDNSQFYKQLKAGEKVGYAEDILWALPPQIEKLSLMGFGASFWRDDDTEGLDPFGRFLNRFENLRELHLLRNAGTVNDAWLQSIISNCLRLQALSFSGDEDLTNYGMTGVDPETGRKTGVSLDQLYGLTHLKIGRCLSVNVQEIIPVLKFRFLLSLGYEGNTEEDQELDPNYFCCQVAGQNPSLERLVLRTNKWSRYDVMDLKKEATKVNRWIRSVKLEPPSIVKFRYRDCRYEPDPSTDEDEEDELSPDDEDGQDEDENGDGVDDNVDADGGVCDSVLALEF